MPRNLPSPMLSEIGANAIQLCWLVDLALISGVVHIWSGMGSVVYNGNTYLGVAKLGAVGEISESSEVKADGVTIQLSGIDPALMTDSLDDIQQGAPATVLFATFSEGAISAAYLAFAGTVDQPSTNIGPEAITIALQLENKMANLQRASNRRYTMSDQRNYYPDDIGFSWVEILNDIALLWG
jgi:hypothetical protein